MKKLPNLIPRVIFDASNLTLTEKEKKKQEDQEGEEDDDGDEGIPEKRESEMMVVAAMNRDRWMSPMDTHCNDTSLFSISYFPSSSPYKVTQNP